MSGGEALVVERAGDFDRAAVVGAAEQRQDLGGERLLLTHVNTAFNCCPEFEAGIDQGEQ